MAPPPPSPQTAHNFATPPHQSLRMTLHDNHSSSESGLRERDSAGHHSAGHANARHARSATIASILDSFDQWELPATTSSQPDDFLGRLSLSSSRRSNQRYSWDRATSLASSPRSTRSRDYTGMPHGINSFDDDHELDSTIDAALSPSIPTSRPPSTFSHYARSSIGRFSFDFGRHRRRSSIASQSSNFGSAWKEREATSKNKLSAESWVRQGLANEAGIERARTLRTMKALKRMDSQEALRYPVVETSDEAPYQLHGDVDPVNQSLRVEQIIPKTPNTISSSRGRLYLSDDHHVGPNEASRSPSPLPDSAFLSDARNLTMSMALRRSSRHSHISDSVPTRTSSLRRTDSPSSTRKKERRRKRGASSRRTSSSTEAHPERQLSVDQAEETIPDSTWADLGEDDSTVKRILQLRELRTQRMVEQESMTATTPSHSMPAFGEFDISPISETDSPTLFSRSIMDTPDVSDSQNRGRAGLSRSTTGLSHAESRRTPSRKDKSFAKTDRSYPPLSLKLNAGHSSPPTSPISPKFGDISTLSVPQVTNSPRRERRRSLVQAFRSSSDRGRNTEQRPGSESKPEAPSGRGSLFRGRSTRRSANPETIAQQIGAAVASKTSKARSPSDAQNRSSMEDNGSHNGVDSIELAIRNYLGAPRLSHRITHPHSGREICFSDVGDPEGAAVVVCVGMGLTRYVTAFFDELAATLGLRLITLDRPGVGGSQPYPSTDKSGPLNWPDDVLAVCQHLDITSFSLLAHSAGAIYALATALVLPHMVKGKVHLLAPWIPLSQLEVNSNTAAAPPPAGAVPRSQRILRALPASFLKAANSSFMTATSASLKPVSKRQLNANRSHQRRDRSPTQVRERPPVPRSDAMRRESIMLMDQMMPSSDLLNGLGTQVPGSRTESRNGNNDGQSSPSVLMMSPNGIEKDPMWHFSTAALEAIEDEDRERQVAYMSELTLRTWELATRDSNPATDLLVCLERNRDIGFRYTDVTRQTVITHGSEDKRVPMGNVKWLADQVNERAKLGNASSPSWDRRAVHSREGWVDHEHARIGCELRILQGEGHGLMASASIMSDVLTEIAGYSTSAFIDGL